MSPRWPEQTVEQRFWSKVRKGPGCWEWQAATNNHGYGKFWVDGKVRGAHVVYSAATLTDAQVAEIRRRVEAGESQKSVGENFPVSKQTISKIVRGERR